jgi:hypothetical protein
MKIKISFLLLFAILTIAGCKKDNSIDISNEIMIPLSEGLGGNSEPWIYSAYQPYFDISNYSNIKSAVLVVSDIKTTGSSFNDLIGEGSFELYDITNNKVIERSIVKSDDIAKNTYLTSDNFIDNIPKGKIKLGVKIYTDGAFYVNCKSIYLILSK